MCGLTFSLLNPEFKLRMHFQSAFSTFSFFLNMWSLAYSSQFPKKEGKNYAWENFLVLPFKGQIPIITSCWSAKWWMSFISGTVQSGGQCLHSLWKLVSWQSKDFHSPLLMLWRINPSTSTTQIYFFTLFQNVMQVKNQSLSSTATYKHWKHRKAILLLTLRATFSTRKAQQEFSYLHHCYPVKIPLPSLLRY